MKDEARRGAGAAPAGRALASTEGGPRTLETYAVQSSESWLEDFGSGKLELGVAVVKIDPAFAETVSADASYHVFITPNGDAEALYVINKTATSCEVRESKGGTSSLSFDYRIVAKRRGYEAQRLTDVTERFNAESALARPTALHLTQLGGHLWEHLGHLELREPRVYCHEPDRAP